MRAIALLLITMLSAVPAVAQLDPDRIEIKVHRVAGAVYMLEGAGGNIGVSVGNDGIILIDDQYAPLAPKIKAALAEITDEPVRFVLNTHWHGDHTGGNEIFGETAPIIAHDNVRIRLREGMTGVREVPPAAEEALPVITFDHRLSIHLNGEEVRALHHPRAHTDGDIAIHFTESNVIHAGDLFFSGRFPFIDLSSGGSIDGLIEAVRSIIEEAPADARIIPGHGPLSGIEELKGYLEMLEAASGVVGKELAAGTTLEQMKEKDVLAPWTDWSGGFISKDRFLETLVKSLGE